MEYKIVGNIAVLNGGELQIDLSRYERDFKVTLDVAENKFGMLQLGLSQKYVAQIHIPAREYEEIKNESDEGVEIKKVALEFDPEKVKIEVVK